MGPEFWQRLLATDAPSERLWRTLESVRAGLIHPDDPLHWHTLTERERHVAASADMTALEKAIAAGATVLELDDRIGPPAVFVDPGVAPLQLSRLAIVGTRGASSYGLSVTASFAAASARAGVAVVSGGALGIDAAAHKATIESGGTTVVVLPCGIDVDYPARHRDLFRSAKAKGCLVSRCACGARTQDHVLIQRNRLVAQLCDALVVIEAPLGSGSLSTAAIALETGRPLFVVPGPVSEPGFRGSHGLIRSGATLVEEPYQVFEAMGWTSQTVQAPNAKRADGKESAVLGVLGGMPKNPESIGREADLDAATVLSALTILEIEGVVVKSPEGYALRP